MWGNFRGSVILPGLLDYFSQSADAILTSQVLRQIIVVKGFWPTLKATHRLSPDFVIQTNEPLCGVVGSVSTVFIHLVPRTFYMLQQLIGFPQCPCPTDGIIKLTILWPPCLFLPLKSTRRPVSLHLNHNLWDYQRFFCFQDDMAER